MDPIALARELVLIPSPTGSEAAVARFAAGVLRAAGYHVVEQEVTAGRFNVYATLDPPVVIFSTHLDVVPPELEVREDEEFLYGRGANDAKGIAASMIAAVETLRAAGERRVGVLLTVGEETDSDGAKAARSLEPKGRYLVNGEPTENRLSVGQKGAFAVRLTATGRAAHSAYPEEGDSAIEHLLTTLGRIRGLGYETDSLLGQTTLNVGRIGGGVAANVIPADAWADVMFRTVGPSGQLRSLLERTLGRAVRLDVTIDTPPVRSAPLPGWDWTVVAYSSDLPHLAEWGMGYQLGPGTIRRAHTASEKIAKSEITTAVELYGRLARQLLHSDSERP
jgi:acetylornithine deacetylase